MKHEEVKGSLMKVGEKVGEIRNREKLLAAGYQEV